MINEEALKSEITNLMYAAYPTTQFFRVAPTIQNIFPSASTFNAGAFTTNLGYQTYATANYSFADGYYTIAGGIASRATGLGTRALRYGEVAHSSFKIAEDGDSVNPQYGSVSFYGTTTDTDTMTEIYLSNTAHTFSMNDGTSMYYEVRVIAADADGLSRALTWQGIAKAVSGVVSLTGTTTMVSIGDTSLSSLSAMTEGADGYMKMFVQGVAGQPINWFATIHYTQTRF